MREVLVARPRGAEQDVPLLFVHGAWHGAWCWAEHFLDWFAARGYASHAVSLRHHAGSRGPGSLRSSSVDDYVDDVFAVAAELSAPPVVIGHSMGGFVTQRYLCRGLPAAGAVLLAAVPCHGVLGTTIRIARRQPFRFAQLNLTMSLAPLVSTQALARELFFSHDVDPTDLERWFLQLGDESYRAFLDMLLQRPIPRGEHPPVHVVGATRDRIIVARSLEATANAWGTAVDWHDAAHDMMLEPAWEAVATSVLRFVEQRVLPAAQRG